MKGFFLSLSRKTGIVGELLEFLWKAKRWWLIPIVIMLIVLGAIFIFASSSPIAPFIYTLF
jgi:hypothetical protein